MPSTHGYPRVSRSRDVRPPLTPPPKYDVPYVGEDRQESACHSSQGCGRLCADGKRCRRNALSAEDQAPGPVKHQL